MTGRILGIGILVTALVAGAALYYLQIYHFYEPVEAKGAEDVVLTSLVSGEAEPVPHADFRAIDADSSPIRYRACFTTPLGLDELRAAYRTYEAAEPLNAPGWFDCFDATAIAAELNAGRAVAFLGQANVEYGIDRVIAIGGDGRGYVWHQINHCGAVVFDGRPAPEDCPEPPQGY